MIILGFEFLRVQDFEPPYFDKFWDFGVYHVYPLTEAGEIAKTYFPWSSDIFVEHSQHSNGGFHMIPLHTVQRSRCR